MLTACVYRVMDARGKFGEHERCVRVARGTAESNSSFPSFKLCATTCNRVSKRTQNVTSNNVGSSWPTMLRPSARTRLQNNNIIYYTYNIKKG